MTTHRSHLVRGARHLRPRRISALVAALVAAVLLAGCFPPPAQSGLLDTTFSADGVVTDDGTGELPAGLRPANRLGVRPGRGPSGGGGGGVMVGRTKPVM